MKTQIKKRIAFLASLALFAAAFAQISVDSKKIGKTLESNKDGSAVFVSEVDLSGMAVADDGKITLPLFAKNKFVLMSGMDMTCIKERIAFVNKKKFAVTFETKNLEPKTYAITKIDGIESFAEYSKRIEKEAKEKWELERAENLKKMPVQVVNQEVINIVGTEAAWLPGQIQDKLKSNFQEYLGMRTVVDAKSEATIKKLQAQSESAARDESAAIELGKITTAKFAVFTKVRKTAKGYVISVDFTDLTTGEQLASVISKEYTQPEYLYGSTGAVDEITLLLANKLGIAISDLNKNLLASGSASFTVDEQLALAKQNEEQYKKLMSQYDNELAKLSVSNDLSAVENKRKIEAEKALLVEKQNAERKRQEELRLQKEREAEDAKLEAERSVALKTQRDKMAKEAAERAAEVRKLKISKQGVFSQINVIESKKKALLEIRVSVEARCQELYDCLENDRVAEEEKIKNKPYGTVELGPYGSPTAAAIERREKQVVKSYQDLTNKFFADCDAVKASTQDSAFLAEIRADQKALATTRTVSSMGDELKVSFGAYDGSQNGWIAYLSLYSEGVLLYTDNFIVRYDAVSGKKAPNMETELNDAVIAEYSNNVDMYNSLFTRGDPIVYFEIDYVVNAESDDKPSTYNFSFNRIRVINTVSGKVMQTNALSTILTRTMQPEQDLRVFAGVEEKEKARFDPKKYSVEKNMADGLCKSDAEKKYAADKKFETYLANIMVKIPGKSIKIMATEVPQWLYERMMGVNPSANEGRNNPVENVSWIDAVHFCNVLSEKFGYEPVYSVNGVTDVEKWNYYANGPIKGYVTWNERANGFRLPTEEEWEYAAKGGQNFNYSGSNNSDLVGWFENNSGGKSHPVAQKRPNGYGLYDMSGNVEEWVWDADSRGNRYCYGGCYRSPSWNSGGIGRYYVSGSKDGGFRVVRNLE